VPLRIVPNAERASWSSTQKEHWDRYWDHSRSKIRRELAKTISYTERLCYQLRQGDEEAQKLANFLEALIFVRKRG
jgi:hypothetical protein